MAFANLFSSLSAVKGDLNTPAQPEHPRRSENDDWKRPNPKKRKRQSEHTWAKKKKQHGQLQESSTSNATYFNNGDLSHQTKTAEGGRLGVGFNGAVVHKQGTRGGHHGSFHDSRSQNTHNVNNKRQQGKNKNNKSYQHHPNEQWRPPQRGRGHQKQTWQPRRFKDYRNNKQDIKVKRLQLMTQEFKDQNVIMANEHMLCRHFLFGKCIKGDECQLKHAEGFNDLIKQNCKFYVQGLCTKGDKCPYMHESFPCKFFHGRGWCPHKEGCRFSHNPLNDTTKPLLEEVLRADQLLREQAEKTKEASAEQPTNAEESQSAEETETHPEVLTVPFKLNFYNSGEPSAFRPNFYNSGATNAAEEPCSPDKVASDAEEEAHHDHETHPQPLDSPSDAPRHSGEAQDGDKPWSGPSPTPGPEGSSSVPGAASACTLNSVCQSPAPYSVEAVFRACKSLRSATLTYSAETPSPEVKVDDGQAPVAKTEGSARPECSPRSSNGNAQLPSGAAHGAGSSGKALPSSGKVLCSLFAKPPSTASSPDGPTRVKLPHSVAPPSPHSIFKGGSGSVGSSESTRQRGLPPTVPPRPTASQTLSKVPTRPFKSLFASSIIDTSTPNSARVPAGPPGSTRPPYPAPDPPDSRDVRTTAEPEGSRTRSVCSLFATPLVAAQPDAPPPPVDLDALPPRSVGTEDPNAARTLTGPLTAKKEHAESFAKLADQLTVDSDPSPHGSSAVSKSVLKGLFLSLGPFQPQGQIQESVERSGATVRLRDQLQPQKKNIRKKKTV